ncbi:hypothetical protein D3C85_173300 [compost metagenome]
MKLKIIKDWKKQLKSYSFLSIAANLFVAISVSGLAVLGVLSNAIAFNILVPVAILFGVLGAAGRFVDQSIDDALERDEEHAK